MVLILELLLSGSNCRSLGFARDDKGKSAIYLGISYWDRSKEQVSSSRFIALGLNQGSGSGTKGRGGASPIVFGPCTLRRTWGTRVDLLARSRLEGEACGIPAIASQAPKKSKISPTAVHFEMVWTTIF
jgi:hypothetical protein